MKENPILFSGEMVRAILEGRKTQTRRVIKPQPPQKNCTGFDINTVINPGDTWQLSDYEGTYGFRGSDGIAISGAWKCPYGQPGDFLWVRETWAALHFVEARAEGYGLGYCEDWYPSESIPKDSNKGYWSCVYAATDSFAQEGRDERGFAWKPSIFMPRWASRITLRITNIRVERVQNISDDDAVAEGIGDLCHCGDYVRDHGYLSGHAAVSMPGWARENFSGLWDSINAKRGYSWESNPWVWVIEFERVSNE